ncbi:MAG: ribosome small subunit-dependent GTPase A [Acidimicrobiales bacterium]
MAESGTQRGDGSSSTVTLAHLGWDEEWELTFRATAGPTSQPARVARIDRGICTALRPDALRVTTAAQPVATGDWIVIGPGPARGDLPLVQAILERRSAFVRHRSGETSAGQVVAANADSVFVVAGLDVALSPARIERYLTLTWQSGSVPVLVLTKADTVGPAETQRAIAVVRAVAADVDIRPVSTRTAAGIAALAHDYLGVGRTAALIGPSGVGKSTLINLLAGMEAMATGATRRDGKGRHTTTHRELLVLASGGVLIDTPGMRSIGLWDADEGLAQTFGDIEDLARECRFADCGHRAEPGCAVRMAVDAGRLDSSRLAHWRKLEDELGAIAERQEATRRATAEPRPRRPARKPTGPARG